MSGPLLGSRVLVTGAAGGIGRAAALAAAARGAQLVLTDIKAGELAETGAMAEGRGAAVLASEIVDVTDHDAVVAFADAVHAEHGPIDVLMNVAGTSTWGTVDRLGHDDWRGMVDVDLMGPINFIEAFVPAMIEAGHGGHLVNVSSAAGLLGLPWHAAYSAAKFGIRGVSEVLRFDLEPHGIGVTLVCPGAVDTPLVESVRIVGIDRDHPAAREMAARFRRRATTATAVAAEIIAAVENGRYLVITSREIKLAFALERWCPPLYRRLMRRLNRELTAVGERAATQRQTSSRPDAGHAAQSRAPSQRPGL